MFMLVFVDTVLLSRELKRNDYSFRACPCCAQSQHSLLPFLFIPTLIAKSCDS